MIKTSCISNVSGQDFKSCSKDLQMARFVMSLQQNPISLCDLSPGSKEVRWFLSRLQQLKQENQSSVGFQYRFCPGLAIITFSLFVEVFLICVFGCGGIVTWNGFKQMPLRKLLVQLKSLFLKSSFEEIKCLSKISVKSLIYFACMNRL